MLLNVLCVVIWHATNINWSTRVRTSFPSKYQEKWNEQQQQQLCRWTWKKVSALIAWKTPTHETIYTKIFENKAQTITCALPKLNTKAPYILNTTPNYFLFVASIVVGFFLVLSSIVPSLHFLPLIPIVCCWPRCNQYHAFSEFGGFLVGFLQRHSSNSRFRSFVQFSIFGLPLSVRLYRSKTFSPILVLSISITMLGVFRFCAWYFRFRFWTMIFVQLILHVVKWL